MVIANNKNCTYRCLLRCSRFLSSRWRLCKMKPIPSAWKSIGARRKSKQQLTHNVQLAGNTVDIVESFTYLGSLIDRSGRCRVELVRRIAICAKLHDTAGSQHLALKYIRVHQDSPLLRIYTASIFV